jgi:hypothetical protein
LNYTPYHLTHASELDAEHHIEVLPETSTDWIELPADGFRGGDGFQRYHRLATAWAYAAQFNRDPAVYAQAIGTHFARQRSLTPKQIRCRRHFLQSQEDLTTGTTSRRNPDDASFFAVVYAANAIVSSTGHVDIVRVDDASQVAAPAPGAGANRGSAGNAPSR